MSRSTDTRLQLCAFLACTLAVAFSACKTSEKPKLESWVAAKGLPQSARGRRYVLLSDSLVQLNCKRELCLLAADLQHNPQVNHPLVQSKSALKTL